MADREKPKKDHYISKGWQKNFAQDDLWVAKFDVAAGQVTDAHLSITGNWAEGDYGAYWLEDGTKVRDVDDGFTEIEGQTIRAVRTITRDNFGPELQDAVIKLLAVHLCRTSTLR